MIRPVVTRVKFINRDKTIPDNSRHALKRRDRRLEIKPTSEIMPKQQPEHNFVAPEKQSSQQPVSRNFFFLRHRNGNWRGSQYGEGKKGDALQIREALHFVCSFYDESI